ncbi:MAG TPA: cob(I)yrinic acid a,c-diamide adenosyltransferase [Chromatiales bacterium]|nr:cob(I)yrinic acid a,c-diamide adenosyltransferase [Chromatiales bacterium]
MGHRLSKIYTRTGDCGDTGLGDGTRVGKDDPRVEACGTVDEINSVLGMVLAEDPPEAVRACLLDVQHDLFDLGGELCLPGRTVITPEYVARLERILDRFNADLPPLKEFILPGGGRAASVCHLARTVCRRAERRLVTLQRSQTVGAEAVRYLNRLSDLLFVLARVLGRSAGAGETPWQRRESLLPGRRGQDG